MVQNHVWFLIIVNLTQLPFPSLSQLTVFRLYLVRSPVLSSLRLIFTKLIIIFVWILRLSRSLLSRPHMDTTVGKCSLSA